MGIITRMRKQDAIHWPKASPDKFGHAGVGLPVPVKVRWEEVQKVFIDPDGEEQLSQAIVYLPEISDGVEAKPGDFLWLGLSASAPADPTVDTNAFKIRQFDKLPTFKATEFLRTAYL